MLNIFLSDIHIGINSPTNWYQKSFHQPYLKAVLRYIRQNANDIKDLVILGDWFDFWTFLPHDGRNPDNHPILPTDLRVVFEQNQELFTPCSDGDFVTCLDSIQGQFYYINGNHDMLTTSNEINNHFSPLSKKRREIICKGSSREIGTYQSGYIYGEHGHQYSALCGPDSNSSNLCEPLPIGHFIARTIAYICNQKLNSAQPNAAFLNNSGNPLFGAESSRYTLAYILELLKNNGNTLARAILFNLVNVAQGSRQPYDFSYHMPEWGSIPAVFAAGMFAHLSVAQDMNGLYVDFNNSLDDHANCEEHKVVIMGHTHVPQIMQYDSIPDAVYANSGYLCASKPDLEGNKAHMTFVEVEEAHETCTVRLKKVDYPGTSISTLSECSIKVP
jgi:UDP-2,3-diacylglucosamine pyrophosphatase LpxH